MHTRQRPSKLLSLKLFFISDTAFDSSSGQFCLVYISPFSESLFLCLCPVLILVVRVCCTWFCFDTDWFLSMHQISLCLSYRPEGMMWEMNDMLGRSSLAIVLPARPKGLSPFGDLYSVRNRTSWDWCTQVPDPT